jgi:hypothetical protein
MKPLKIPTFLNKEFKTVECIWESNADTRGLDCLILSWVKYEKQLRRLFCFLLFQHPNITKESIKEIIEIIADNKELYPYTLIKGIETLSKKSFSTLLGDKFTSLSSEMERINKYRNKLVHGQITGQNINRIKLENDVILIINWIDELGNVAQKEFGYNGIDRNTFKKAKRLNEIYVKKYPFNNSEEFREWLTKFARNNKKPSLVAQGTAIKPKAK